MSAAHPHSTGPSQATEGVDVTANIRSGPQSDILRLQLDVRFTPQKRTFASGFLPPNLGHRVRREHCVSLSQVLATLGQ
jgi:hypothetical protein